MKTIFMLSLSILLLAGCKKATEPTNDIGHPIVQMVHVTGGTYLMGSNDPKDYFLASPRHSVTVGSFSIEIVEITYETWTEVLNWGLVHGYADLPPGRNGYNGTTKHPVTEVNWYDILKWCNARSEKNGLSPAYCTDSSLSTIYRTGQIDLAPNAVKWTSNGYRLPTEAEWEFATRGGVSSKGYTYSGSNNVDSVAWYRANSGGNTYPVGAKAPNELGIYDMSGNVGEYCWDWHGAWGETAQADPRGSSSGTYRVARGGSFSSSSADQCRVAFRASNLPSNRLATVGFRCVQD